MGHNGIGKWVWVIEWKLGGEGGGKKEVKIT